MIRINNKAVAKNNKKLIVFVLLTAALLLAVILLRYSLRDWRTDHIREITVSQDGDALDIGWNKVKSGRYRLVVNCSTHAGAETGTDAGTADSTGDTANAEAMAGAGTASDTETEAEAGTQDSVQVLDTALDTNRYRLESIEYLADYTITVYGETDDGVMAAGIPAGIFTRQPQKISAECGELRGYSGDSFDLGAGVSGTAGAVTYSTSSSRYASVDESGKVILGRPGAAEITITAEGDDLNLPGSLIVTATCYPDRLGTPSLRLHQDNGNSVVLRLGRVEFAEKYDLLRRDPLTGKDRVIKTFTDDDFIESGSDAGTAETADKSSDSKSAGEGKDSGSGQTETDKNTDSKSLEADRKEAAETRPANHIDVELAHDMGIYRLRASVNVGSSRLVSDKSSEVEIISGLDSAAVYSSLTNILEIGSDDVVLAARARGAGSATNAQSMCASGDGYIVALVNRGNSVGRLEKYDKKTGELVKAADTGHIGHANGCTYDPHTGSIYVMKTYASGKYHEFAVFDAESLERRDSLGFSTAPSGIGYDETADQFYLTASSRIYVTDGGLSRIRTIYRKRAYRSQDACGYNGIAMSCIWTGGSSSYIDMYRALTGDYLGSIYVPFGEIEGACVDDGYLVMLFNGGSIYRTRERVRFPGQNLQ